MPARIPYDPALRHVLLIAGTAGAGKSTFVEQLHAGGADREILARLPPGVTTWPLVRGPLPRFRGARHEPAAQPRGQIVHHEITNAFRQRPEHRASKRLLFSISEDQRLQRYLAAAVCIHVLVVRPAKERLISQLRSRVALMHIPQRLRPAARRLSPLLQHLESELPAWVNGNAHRILGRRWSMRSERKAISHQLCEVYSREGALEAIYAHWEASLIAEHGDRLVRPFVYIEPVQAKGRQKRFRLADANPLPPLPALATTN